MAKKKRIRKRPNKPPPRTDREGDVLTQVTLYDAQGNPVAAGEGGAIENVEPIETREQLHAWKRAVGESEEVEIIDM